MTAQPRAGGIDAGDPSMTAGWSRWRGALVLGVLLVGPGCVPIPVPFGAHDIGLRGNIGEAVPETVITGQTTREEVVLALGEPDGAALDGSWMVWTTGSSSGGVDVAMLLVTPLAVAWGGMHHTEGESYRRLTVRFDARGVVSASRIDTESCRQYRYEIEELDIRAGQSHWTPCVGWKWVVGLVDTPMVPEGSSAHGADVTRPAQ